MRDLKFPDAVEESGDFFGRDDSLAAIREALLSAGRKTVVILGGRLIGKTSLLNVVAEWAELGASFSVVKLAHAHSREELAAELLHGIQENVREPAAAGPAPTATAAAPPPGHADDFRFSTVAGFVRVVVQLVERAPRSRFLVCVDELDSLLNDCSETAARQILDLLLHLIERTKLPLRFMFTISDVPQHVRLSYASPFLNQSTIVALRPWSPVDSRRFADWLLVDRLQLDDEAHRVLHGAAGGHPYFIKAVLREALREHRAGAAGGVTPPAAMRAAATTAARSPEVAVSLANITEVHFSEPSVRLLDRAAAAPGGVGDRDVQELGVAPGDLDKLLGYGFLSGEGGRWSLGLGLWSHWRAPQLGGRGRPAGRAARVARACRRFLAVRGVKAALIVLLGLVPLVGLGAAFAVPSGTLTAESCAQSGSGLRATVSYPSYVSSGGVQHLQIVVANEGSGRSSAGSVLVRFPKAPPGDVRIGDDNVIRFDALDPGEQHPTVLPFRYSQPRRLLPDTTSRVPAELTVFAGGLPCAAQRWTMAVAPIPHLRDGLKGLLGLAGASSIALIAEWMLYAVGRLHAARE